MNSVDVERVVAGEIIDLLIIWRGGGVFITQTGRAAVGEVGSGVV